MPAASHVVSLKPNKESECFMSPYLQLLRLRVPSLPLMLAGFAISLNFFPPLLQNHLCPVVLFSAWTGFSVMLPHCSEFPYYVFSPVRWLTASHKVRCQRFSKNKEELTAIGVIRYYLFTMLCMPKKTPYTLNESWKGFSAISAVNSK